MSLIFKKRLILIQVKTILPSQISTYLFIYVTFKVIMIKIK